MTGSGPGAGVGAAVGTGRGARLVAGGKSVGCVETAGAGSGFATEEAGGAGDGEGAEGSGGADGPSLEKRKDSSPEISGSPYWCT